MSTSDKLTKAMRLKIDEAAAYGCTNAEIALYCDIETKTIYNWFNRDPKLKERVKQLKDKPILLARQTVLKAIKNDNAEMALKYLERKKKDEFSLKTETEVKGSIENKTDLDNLPLKDKKEILEIMKRSNENK